MNFMPLSLGCEMCMVCTTKVKELRNTQARSVAMKHNINHRRKTYKEEGADYYRPFSGALEAGLRQQILSNDMRYRRQYLHVCIPPSPLC